MTLRLTLAGMLVLALACGGSDSAETPDGPPPPPPPPADDGGSTSKTDLGGKEAPPPPEKSIGENIAEQEAAKAEADGTADLTYETKEIATKVKLPPAQRKDLRSTGERLLEAEATKLGYTSVAGVKLGKPSCDGEWCTATVTGKARKVVEAPEGEATEEAAEGEAAK